MKDAPSCPLCGTGAAREHVRLDRFRVVECGSCGFQWADPMPTADQLAAFYNDPAYYHGCESGYEDYASGEPGHRRLARGRLARLAALGAGGRVLDWGCGPGYFLSEAARAGWQVAGVELADDMRAIAARVAGAAVYRDVEAAADAVAPFDVVTLWECIEHLPDPMAAARRAAVMLRPGGLLALSTPNTAHRIARLRPHAWREYKPPAHVGYFTAGTAARCLEQAGFAVVEHHFTTPMWSPGLGDRLRPLALRCGTGGDRKTRAWWLYSLAFRALSLPAHFLRAFRPAAACAGLEVYARRL